MLIKYHSLPFGAQLLLWTSRIFFNGSCRTNPNKYEIIDIAYKKVGIDKGGVLLNRLLALLKNEKVFEIQTICMQYLNESEKNLIDCIEEHKKKEINNNYFIKIWKLDRERELFTYSAKSVAFAFKKANLITDINFQYKTEIQTNILYEANKTLH